eukprot:TRINITY_DN2331_c0_g1_i1.p2 TRINITY_DN2331_c0_g1~~TRINITY_DN2331_c0_g1_i1.p2  ORF type:complete len:196 (-),score=78.68 TRINITY_DN2331_c0_g1_i1:110-631(-)
MDKRSIASFLALRAAATTSTTTSSRLSAAEGELFSGRKAIAEPIAAYAARLLGCYAQASDGSVAEGTLALILVERFAGSVMRRTGGAEDGVTASTLHRLFLAALLVATKFLNDAAVVSCGNKGAPLLVSALAAAGGVEAEELARLELALLVCVGFDVNVSRSEYCSFCVLNRW